MAGLLVTRLSRGETVILTNMDWILINELQLRLWIFGGGLTLFLCLGAAFSFRRIAIKIRSEQWAKNAGFAIASSILLKLLLPFTLTGIALYAHSSQQGLFYLLALPVWLEFLLMLLFLDILIYWQHRISHVVPLFWRVHRLHHSDTEFDTSTALRFHPIEILASYLLKAVAVLALGVSPVAIIIYEIVLSFCALFNHSNFTFSKRWEPFVRAILVTPSMHRVHHSTQVSETNSNYSTCLSCWDRLFSSYVRATARDPANMAIGLEEFRTSQEQGFLALILQPFK